MGRSSQCPLALVVVVSASLVAAACAGGGGDVGPASADASGDDVQGRCDLGFNTAAFNETRGGDHRHPQHAHEMGAQVDFTVRAWAEVFADEGLGLTVAEVAAEVEADDIYRRHVLGGVLTDTLAAQPWVPMTDASDCDAIAAQLQEAREAAARHPTVADAVAAGYVQGDTYFAGLGVHYQDYGYQDRFDPAHPVQFLYDGTDDDSALAGLSYVVRRPGDEPPEGFVGDNDHWHRHRSFCLDADGVNMSSDVLSESECTVLGGVHVPNAELWMLHMWAVPGCENDWGLFSYANPALPYLPDDASFATGCNSGRTVADPLDLDDSGTGPRID
ncbi:MAG: hypothetical protein ACRD2C_07465 [Acidimicrobiales bacterium]